jgi:hypothetical protein
MIQTLVQELYHFLCFQIWPPCGQDTNQIGPKFGLGVNLTHAVIHMYKDLGQSFQRLQNVPC